MNKLMILFLCFAILGLVLSACEYQETPTGEVVGEDEIIIEEIEIEDEIEIEEIEEEEVVVVEPEEEEMEELPEDVAIKIEGVEGDLFDLNPVAVDPDGDIISYAFSEPFNENGLWQTNEGDAGRYLITITASDGKAEASETILVVVKESNKPPVITCPDSIQVEEGDTVELGCDFSDNEGDDVIVDYSGWMTSQVKETGFNDAGTHTVVVKASDGKRESTKDIKVVVKNKNRAPIVAELEDIYAIEGDIVTLNIDVTDPDGDRITIEYSEPFDSRGIFSTKDGDSGEYNVWVSVSDDEFTEKISFKLFIEDMNTAPKLKKIPDITVFEGDTVEIPIDAFDPEGNEVTVSLEGWMTSDTYVTSYEDANPNGCEGSGCTATYTVKVIVSDGKLDTTQTVTIYVKDKNRPPVFRVPA